MAAKKKTKTKKKKTAKVKADAKAQSDTKDNTNQGGEKQAEGILSGDSSKKRASIQDISFHRIPFSWALLRVLAGSTFRP